MLKFLTGFAALGMLVAVSATTPADARTATPGAKAESGMTDFSSQYYRRGYYRGGYYPYYGYYRPYRPYYYRPYYRPAPFPFFPFSPYYR